MGWARAYGLTCTGYIYFSSNVPHAEKLAVLQWKQQTMFEQIKEQIEEQTINNVQDKLLALDIIPEKWTHEKLVHKL